MSDVHFYQANSVLSSNIRVPAMSLLYFFVKRTCSLFRFCESNRKRI